MTQPHPNRPTYALPPRRQRPQGPRIPLPATGLQKAAPVIAWIGLGTPVFWVAAKTLSGAGWLLISYLMMASWLVLISQIVLLVPVLARCRITLPAAGGPVSTPMMLAAIILHPLSALFIGDFGDSPKDVSQPFVTKALGIPEDVAGTICWLLVLAWLVLQVATIVIAYQESSRERLEAQASGTRP